MSIASEKSERDPFEQLAETFMARYRAGERPSVQEYADRFPELAEQIRALLPALVMMEEHRPGKEELANVPSVCMKPSPTMSIRKRSKVPSPSNSSPKHCSTP